MKVPDYQLDAPKLGVGWQLEFEPLSLRNGELTIRLDRVSTTRDLWTMVCELVEWTERAAPSDPGPPLHEALAALVAILPTAAVPPSGRLSPERWSALAETAIVRQRAERRGPSQRFVATSYSHLAPPVAEIHDGRSSLGAFNDEPECAPPGGDP